LLCLASLLSLATLLRYYALLSFASLRFGCSPLLRFGFGFAFASLCFAFASHCGVWGFQEAHRLAIVTKYDSWWYVSFCSWKSHFYPIFGDG
jgi:hypothetical protein